MKKSFVRSVFSHAGSLTSLSKNIVANYVGQGWSALMGLLFIPLYIKFLGAEAYGVIGLYSVIYGVFNVLDFGFTATMNRELALYSVRVEKAREMRDFVRSLEVIYWVVGIFIGISIIGLAPFIADHWVNAQKISSDVIQRAIIMMGLLAFLQWPLSLYQGGLLGLQKQVLVNSLSATMNTIRSGGSVLILWLVSPSLIVFFYWQLVVAAIQVLITIAFLWKNLPKGDSIPVFRFDVIKRIWRFATGIGVASIMTLLRYQVDKIIVSKLVSLEMFGYYVIASSVGNALSSFGGPIFTATFPRLAVLIGGGDLERIKNFYHRSCQLVAAIAIPSALVVSLFSFELISLWTWNLETAKIVAPVLSVIAIGTMLNSLAGMPYDLQVAYGWTKLTVYKSLISFVILAPAIFFFTKTFGLVGAGFSWVLVNSGYILIEVPIMHRRLLKGEMRRWYVEDVGIPLLWTLLAVVLLRVIIPQMGLSLSLIPVLMIVSALSLVASILSVPLIKSVVFSWWRSIQSQVEINGRGS